MVHSQVNTLVQAAVPELNANHPAVSINDQELHMTSISSGLTASLTNIPVFCMSWSVSWVLSTVIAAYEFCHNHIGPKLALRLTAVNVLATPL